MRILLVEDDDEVAKFVRGGLVAEGFAVDTASDGRAAFIHALEETYDLIVLDILIPYVDGLELLSRLRKEGCVVPVLILSAKDSVPDRVRGLSCGADDYLVKPFSFSELLARVRALLRRRGVPEQSCLQLGDLKIDFASHKVARNGCSIALTTKEFALLEYLVRNRDVVVSRAMIAEHVWDQHFDSFSNTIDVYIRYLRAKLEAGNRAKLIHTVRGVGYLFSTEPQ
jgi:two-component system copper resistance phosphate regulon response regulator CusR